MKIQSRLDQKEIVVDVQQNKNYGIMLSGGIDSTILLYFIIKDFKDKNLSVNIQPFTIAKMDGSYKYVNGIVEYFNSYFGITIPQTIIVGDPSLHHSEQNKSGVIEVFKRFPKTDFIFLALNQNPPDSFGDPNWVRPARITKSPDPRILLPFVELYKTHIIDLMFEYGQEQLMNITHSCTEQPIGRCNTCFQCSERAWAFDQLEKTDTGKL